MREQKKSPRVSNFNISVVCCMFYMLIVCFIVHCRYDQCNDVCVITRGTTDVHYIILYLIHSTRMSYV